MFTERQLFCEHHIGKILLLNNQKVSIPVRMYADSEAMKDHDSTKVSEFLQLVHNIINLISSLV